MAWLVFIALAASVAFAGLALCMALTTGARVKRIKRDLSDEKDWLL